MNITNYGLKEAFVFTDFNVEVKGNIIYYPIYMLMFLINDDVDILLPNLKDLSL